MEAAIALFEEDDATSTALVESLSRVVFDTPQPAAASGIKRVLARLALRYLTRTTSVVDGVHRNPSLERTKYDYALIMLHSSDEESANLVEGGDPMNAPYMMGLPEIRENATIWDRLFLDSVISLDVRLRFRWETTATYELAKAKLDSGSPVRLKAGAAGTGLSMILAYHRLIKDGYEPERITVHITDRAPENCAKTNKLLAHLGYGGNITAYPEDLLEAPEPEQPYDVLTLVGILEYFIGTTATTTEELQGKPAPTTGPPRQRPLPKRRQNPSPRRHPNPKHLQHRNRCPPSRTLRQTNALPHNEGSHHPSKSRQPIPPKNPRRLPRLQHRALRENSLVLTSTS